MSEVRFFVSSPTGPAPGGSKSAFPIYKRKGVTPCVHGQRPSMAHPCPSCWFTGRVAVSDAGGDKTKLWRQEVAKAALIAMREADLAPFECALEVEMIFQIPRPKSHFRSDGVTLRPGSPLQHVTRPDVLKFTRATEDSLTGICFADDSQIVKETIEKAFSGQAGGWVIIKPSVIGEVW